jgi:hypothetical protein
MGGGWDFPNASWHCNSCFKTVMEMVNKIESSSYQDMTRRSLYGHLLDQGPENANFCKYLCRGGCKVMYDGSSTKVIDDIPSVAGRQKVFRTLSTAWSDNPLSLEGGWEFEGLNPLNTATHLLAPTRTNFWTTGSVGKGIFASSLTICYTS